MVKVRTGQLRIKALKFYVERTLKSGCALYKRTKVFRTFELQSRHAHYTPGRIIHEILRYTFVYVCCKVRYDWLFNSCGVLCGAAVFPAMLAIVWARCTRAGVIAGYVIGLMVTMGVWLYATSTEPDGLGNFLENSSKHIR